MSNVLLARQPIYDRRLSVYAYELLYRRERLGPAGLVGVKESAETLVRAIIEIGLDQLVGDKIAFINVPAYLLNDPAIELLPTDRVVLEILEDTPPTKENIDAINRLREKDYKFALDDYVFGSEQTAFVPLCKVVKVDIELNKRSVMQTCADYLKKERVRLLAEKIETTQLYTRCQALGFNYFQGYFFARPEIVAGREIPPSRAVLIHLLTRLQDPSVTMDELEKLVASDVTLTFRLLKLVNSVCLAPSETVASVRAALMMLGLERVVALVSLLTLAGIGDKPTELMVTAMVRAKMCEAMATSSRLRDPEKHFMVGLLSVLEALLDLPFSEILQEIPIASDLRDALTNPESTGELGRTLQLVMSFEEGNWNSVEATQFAETDIAPSYITAVKWADEAKTALAA